MVVRPQAKAAAVLSTAVLAAVSLASCSSPAAPTQKPDDGGGTLTMGINSGLVPTFEKYVEDFTASHDGWDITVAPVPDAPADYVQQLVTQALSGSTPDIIFNYDVLNQTLAGNDLLFDLKPWLDEGKNGLSGDDLLPNFLGQYAYGDKVTGIPVSADTFLLQYNVDLFEKYGVDLPTADWTTEDMYAAAKAITKASDGAVYGMSTPIGTGSSSAIWYPVLRAHGADLYDASTNEFVFASPEGIAAWEEMLQPYLEEFSAPYSENGDANLFFGGQTAMLIGSTGGIAQVRDTMTANWNVVPFPKSNGKPAVGGGSYSLSISDASEHKEDAWTFLSWLYSEEGGKFTSQNGVVPPTAEGLAGGAWTEQENPVPADLVPTIKYSTENAVLLSPLPDDAQPSVAPAITEAIEKVVLQKTSVEQAFTEAQEKLNGQLSQ